MIFFIDNFKTTANTLVSQLSQNCTIFKRFYFENRLEQL